MKLSKLNPTRRLLICKADLNEAKEQNKKMYEALNQAVLIIKQWHGKECFDIYFNNAPEMKPIRSILNDLKS